MLQHFDPGKACQVETDASKEAAGGILSQPYEMPEGRIQWKPVAFFSKKFSKEQRNYSTGDQEMLAIVMAFREWRHYLDAPAGRTIVLCDHQALQSFMSTKDLQGRQVRWAEALAAFNFEIRYRKGKDNPADGLSRRPDHMVREGPVENPLKELITLRLRDSSEEHVRRIAQCDEITVGLMTRGMARTAENASHRIIPTDLGSRPDASEQHAMPPADNPPTEETKAEVEAPDSVVGEETAVTSPITRIPTSLENHMRHIQAQDAWCQGQAWKEHAGSRITKGEFKGQWSIDSQGLVRCNSAVFVPNDPATRADIMRLNHDDPWQGGHFGRERTYEVISRFYYWPQLRAQVSLYVDTCDVCQRMKVPRHKPYGLLAPLPQPEGPWQDISLDFIVGLPPSLRMQHAYDAILVVVDRYSKMVRYIPTNNDVDATGVGTLIIDNILSKFGIPRSIVSDRGSIFTSSFWGTLCYYLAMRRCFSTAFHPQTDGQTERMNQTLECYLRCYINFQQDNWTELLACAEYVTNQAVNATTKKSPFELVYKFTPSMRINLERGDEGPQRENEAAKEQADSIRQAQIAADLARDNAVKSMAKHYDKKRKGMVFKPEDLVKLAAKNIRTVRVSTKLADRFLGPFKVVSRIGTNAYKLDLPKKYGRLHHTFHVSLLEPFRVREGCEPPEPIDIEGDEEWEVQEILSERKRGRGTQFYVRWKGFSEAHDSWEPERHLLHARDAIADFRNRKTG